MTDAKGEAAYAASFFEWFSEEAPRIYGDTIPASIAGNRVVTIKEPVGVCGLITPYASYLCNVEQLLTVLDGIFQLQ